MKIMTFIPIGGLANRIYAITSAIGFCLENNIKLKVLWFKDWGMGAGFYDLFILSTPDDNIKIIEANFVDFFLYDKPKKSNLWLSYFYQKWKFDGIYSRKELSGGISFEEWYQLHKNAMNLYVMHCYKIIEDKNYLNELSPIIPIKKTIDERLKLLSPHTIGIHIRRTDHFQSIQESPLFEFVNKMKQEIEIEPATNFYVASDSKDEKSQLKTIFGNKIITMDKFVRRDIKEGIIEALVELFTLAGTKKIYGSSGSTYSMLAAQLSNIPIEIICKK